MSDEEKLHVRMLEDLRVLTVSWRAAGISPASMLAFFLKTAFDTAEAAGVSFEIAQGVLNRSYGRGIVHARPHAKA